MKLASRLLRPSEQTAQFLEGSVAMRKGCATAVESEDDPFPPGDEPMRSVSCEDCQEALRRSVFGLWRSAPGALLAHGARGLTDVLRPGGCKDSLRSRQAQTKSQTKAVRRLVAKERSFVDLAESAEGLKEIR